MPSETPNPPSTPKPDKTHNQQLKAARNDLIRDTWKQIVHEGFTGIHGSPYTKSQHFRYHGVSYREGNRILNGEDDARRQHNAVTPEARGRKKKISNEDIWNVERVLAEGPPDRKYSWEQLAKDAGLNVNGRTLFRAMGSKDHFSCVTCKRGWVNASEAEARLQHAKQMLDLTNAFGRWNCIRWSTEVHFGKSPTGRVRVIPKPGERYCRDCIPQEEQPEERDIETWHAWTAVGHDLKENLIWYDLPADSKDESMSEGVYLDRVLRPVVMKWKEDSQDFLLEHGTVPHFTSWNAKGGVRGIACQFEYDHGIQAFYINAGPDLRPMEYTWFMPEQQGPGLANHYSVKELAEERWKTLSQDEINAKAFQMYQHYANIVAMGGGMRK